MNRRFRWSSFIDAVVILAVLVAVNVLWFRHDPAFRSWSIHPYLLPIALIGLFYGFREALMTVLACNAVYASQLAFAGLSWHSLLVRPDAQNAAAFLLSGLFFGEAGELYQRALGHHRGRAASLEQSLKKVADEKERLELANKELQEWVRFGDIELVEIHAALPDLLSPDESRILESATPLTARTLGADQCSLYWYDRNKNRFWRRAHTGQGTAANPATIAGDATPFVQIRQTQRVVTIKDVETFSSGVRFLAAAPLLVQGNVQGALLIESMPLVRLTPNTVAKLGLIADLINRALNNAALLKQGDTTVDRTSFLDRLHQEVHASNRYKADLSLLYVDVIDFDVHRSNLGAEGSQQLIDQISRAISKVKRKSDVLSYEGGGRFALLMPQTAPNKTEAFMERTREEVRTIKVPEGAAWRPELSFDLGQNALAQAGLQSGDGTSSDERPTG